MVTATALNKRLANKFFRNKLGVGLLDGKLGSEFWPACVSSVMPHMILRALTAYHVNARNPALFVGE